VLRWWLLILLALPGVARADAAWQPFGLDGGPAEENADAAADAEPALDLTFEPVTSERPQRRAATSLAPPSAERAPQAPFSVGLDIRTRHEVGDEARQEAADEPALADEVGAIMRRSTFGLTGTYRF
jgi:hypothetical protein